MSTLSKSQFNAILRVVVGRKDHTKLTNDWKYLHEQYCVGVIDGKNITFSREDRNILQKLAEAKSGIDCVTESIIGSRTEIAETANNEKWSTSTILGSRIFVSAIGTDLILHNGRLTPTPGVEFRVDCKDLEMSAYDSIIVIENLEAYIRCHDFVWPQIGKALIIYKGNDIE